jgi:hypothetical protein
VGVITSCPTCSGDRIVHAPFADWLSALPQDDASELASVADSLGLNRFDRWSCIGCGDLGLRDPLTGRELRGLVD